MRSMFLVLYLYAAVGGVGQSFAGKENVSPSPFVIAAQDVDKTCEIGAAVNEGLKTSLSTSPANQMAERLLEFVFKDSFRKPGQSNRYGWAVSSWGLLQWLEVLSSTANLKLKADILSILGERVAPRWTNFSSGDFFSSLVLLQGEKIELPELLLSRFQENSIDVWNVNFRESEEERVRIYKLLGLKTRDLWRGPLLDLGDFDSLPSVDFGFRVPLELLSVLVGEVKVKYQDSTIGAFRNFEGKSHSFVRFMLGDLPNGLCFRDPEAKMSYLALPAAHPDLTLILAVPDGDEDLKMSFLKPNTLLSVYDRLTPQRVQFKIPAFKVQTSIDVLDYLSKDRGMSIDTLQFFERLHFIEELSVDRFLAKTFFSLTGMKRSGDSTQSMSATSPQAVSIKAERPFGFSVLHKPSRTFLTLGIVDNVKASISLLPRGD